MARRMASSERGAPVRLRIDVRSVACPLTWVRTRIALDRVGVGDAIEVVLAAGEPLENVPRTAEEEGHRVALREPVPDQAEPAWRLVIVKGAPYTDGFLP